ncbi:MAG: metallophosphoesterase family protein, partial [bacterium]
MLAGAGDIATCLRTDDEATANLLDGIAGTVFTLGDHVYPDGAAQDFTDCYEPSWGRHKARTLPVVGNRDYGTPGAAGYYDYFGSAGSPLDTACSSNCKGYYGYDAGNWHVIALNSECSLSGGTGCVPSEMEQWLRDDLASNSSACTLALWHKPVRTIGPHANDEGSMLASWRILYDYGADLVVNGHEHSYARYGGLNREANGVDNAFGMRQIVVGTGGFDLSTATRTATTPGLEAWQDATTANAFGVLKLVLDATSYSWEFLPVGGTFADSGNGSCHAAPTAREMSIDTYSDGNGATSLSPRDPCVQVAPGDARIIDVTVLDIPPYDDRGTPADTSDDNGGMIGYSYVLQYDSANLAIEAQDANYLL